MRVDRGEGHGGNAFVGGGHGALLHTPLIDIHALIEYANNDTGLIFVGSVEDSVGFGLLILFGIGLLDFLENHFSIKISNPSTLFATD